MFINQLLKLDTRSLKLNLNISILTSTIFCYNISTTIAPLWRENTKIKLTGALLWIMSLDWYIHFWPLRWSIAFTFVHWAWALHSPSCLEVKYCIHLEYYTWDFFSRIPKLKTRVHKTLFHMALWLESRILCLRKFDGLNLKFWKAQMQLRLSHHEKIASKTNTSPHVMRRDSRKQIEIYMYNHVYMKEIF